MTALIETRRLRREYGTLVAVEAANLCVGGGQVVGLIGPNGAGKTTLLKMLATLLTPTGGEIVIAGLDARQDFLRIRQCLGYMPDFFNLYNDLTLFETVAFFADAYGVPQGSMAERARQALLTVDLSAKANELVRNLSRGMMQRLGLATLLVRDPQVLLLDEPASGLDPLARMQLRDILKRLRSEGRAIIISSHILPELEGFCTDIVVMNRGRIVVSGSIEETARKLKGGRVFAVGVKGDAGKARTTLECFPGVQVKLEENGGLLAEVADAGFDETSLVHALVQAGVRVASFCERRRSIEDVFLMVSGPGAEAPAVVGGEVGQ
jgi:ABC-2 type transport system ATP-binding protein